MIYNNYSQAWLEDNMSIRALFVVISVLYDSSGTGASYTPTTLYFSTDGMNTDDGLISFNPILNADITLTESIVGDGSTSMSFGDISILNPNGELDAYLDPNYYIWVNRPIQIYLGDPTWSSASTDFSVSTTKYQLVFNGLVNDIDSKSIEELNIKLRDKMDRLNNPVTESKLGTYGTWVNNAQNEDTIKPLVFGEVFNMSPLLVDPNVGGGQYMVNDGPIQAIIEIRDNGIPIFQHDSTVYTGATPDLTTGMFVLQYPPKGLITASVQGIKTSADLVAGTVLDNTYTNRLAELIAVIVTQYGPANSRLTFDDIDLINFEAINLEIRTPLGTVITDNTNIIVICQLLAVSVGAQILFSREGKLQLLRYGIGTTAAEDARITIGDSTTSPITVSDILQNTMSISNKIPMIGAVCIGYCKNWTVQTGLQTAIPADHKQLFSTEWLSTTSKASSGLVANYALTVEVPQIDTSLLVTADAVAEADRRLAFYTVQRYTYKFSGIPKLLALRLGQQVYLSHSRFNLYNGGSGKLGQVVTISPNWTSTLVDIEVLV